MNIDEQFDLEHLLFKERSSKLRGQTKEMRDEFNLTRIDKVSNPTANSN